MKIVRRVQIKMKVYKPIKVIVVKNKKYYAAMQRLKKWFIQIHVLYIDEELLTFPEPAQEAIIAHEIAHIKKDDEKKCDKIAVKHGYGEGLLLFHKEHKKRGYKKYKKKEGLSPKEIKALLKKY